MTPYSIGVVGAGEITRRSHLPVLANLPDVRIAWLFDQRPDAVEAMAEAHGLRALHGLPPARLPEYKTGCTAR